MTKSIIHFTRIAYRIAKKALPPYSHKNLPHKYTQPQLFAILALRRSLDMDYRGIVQLLMEWPQLRKYLGLKCIPHYSTACLSAARFLKKDSPFAFHCIPKKHTKGWVKVAL
jgi:hypothetical protein